MSDTERWQTVDRLLDEALDLPPEKRLEFIEAIDDPQLRGEVRELLEHSEAEGDLLDRPLADSAPELLDELDRRLEPVTIDPGLMLGPYRLVERIGQGGMGVVYLAERADGQFEKKVAVKLMNRGLGDETARTRFVSERQILADLEHPNVARLLDGGVTGEGFLYIVMEYVEGQPIDEYCSENDIGLEGRLELFLTICEAVEAAHQRQVVHRDLKPGNILVTPKGEVKLLDFGIAKLLNPGQGTPDVSLTQTGFFLMTPDYAAPEQLTDTPITPASDVYALGILLYLLVTGERPYDLRGLSPRRVQEIVCQEPIHRPSSAGDSPSLARRVRVALDRCVLKALQKDPAQRYSSAGELADDLRAILEALTTLEEREPPFHRDPESGRIVIGRSGPSLSKVAGLVSTVAAVAVVLTLWAPWRTGPPPPAEHLIVVPFRADSEATTTTTAGLAAWLADELRLERDWSVLFLEPAASSRSGGRSDPVEMANRLGARHLLLGSLDSDEGLALSAELVELPSAEAIWSGRARAGDGEWSRLAAELRVQVRAALGEVRPSDSATPGTGFAAYLNGLSALRGGDLVAALPLLERATEQSPDFSPGWTALGRGYARSASQLLIGERHQLAAEAALEKAINTAPADPRPRSAMADLMISSNSVEKALVSLLDLAETRPYDAQILWSLSDAYRYAGRLDDSLTYGRRARMIDPTAGFRPFTTALFAGSEDLVELPTGTSFEDELVRGIALLSSGRRLQARLTFAQLPRDASAPRPVGEIWRAIGDGREEDARALLVRLERILNDRLVLDGEQYYRAAQGFAAAGDIDASLRLLERAVEQGFLCGRCFERDPLLAGLRNRSALGELVARAERRSASAISATASSP